MVEGALANAGLSKESIDWLVLHQANQRILASAADRLGVPPGARLLPPAALGFCPWRGSGREHAAVPPGSARRAPGCVCSSGRKVALCARNARACVLCGCTPAERVVSNLSEYGNTSAASIPLALDEAVRRGDIQPGQVVRRPLVAASCPPAGALARCDGNRPCMTLPWHSAVAHAWRGGLFARAGGPRRLWRRAVLGIGHRALGLGVLARSAALAAPRCLPARAPPIFVWLKSGVNCLLGMLEPVLFLRTAEIEQNTRPVLSMLSGWAASRLGALPDGVR